MKKSRVSLKEKVEEFEREEIIRALRQCGWVKAKAARVLGITERMIGYKIQKYGIRTDASEERAPAPEDEEKKDLPTGLLQGSE